MRQIVLALALTVLPAMAVADSLKVGMNQVTRVTLSSPAKDVIVGNPEVADVTVTDRRHLLVVGKMYGSTNLIVTTEGGKVLMDRQINVTSPAMPSVDRVTMITAGKTETYACTPQCQSAKEVGQTLNDLGFGARQTGAQLSTQTGPVP